MMVIRVILGSGWQWRRGLSIAFTLSLVLLLVDEPAPGLCQVGSGDDGNGSRYEAGHSMDSPVIKVLKLCRRPEGLGFRLGDWQYGLGGSSHIQGIARFNSADGTPYLFVTTSGSPGQLLVVEMASRDRTGERMRSNRINVFLDTKDTPPPPGDKVVVVHDLEWNHGGGVQVIDHHLVVAVEAGIGVNQDKEGSFIIYNVSDPKNISKVYEHDDLGHKAGVVAITQESDGHYLIMLGPSAYCGCEGTSWDNSNHYMRFFRSDLKNDISGGYTYVNQWHADGDFNRQDNQWDPTYQTLNFVQDETTRYLYVIGMWNSYTVPGVAGGDDYIDVFRVTKVGGDYQVVKDAVVHKLHMNSKTADNQEQCNFIGSGGVYISPGGELIIYSTTHYKETASSIDYIRVAEYRSIDIASVGSPLWGPRAMLDKTDYEIHEGDTVQLNGSGSRPQSVKGFIELFENDDYNGEMVAIDWDDYSEFVITGQSWINLDTVDGFGANADSLKLYIPPGSSILLMHKDWENNGLGISLVGSPDIEVASFPDLDAHRWQMLYNDVWYPTDDPMGDDIKYIAFYGNGSTNLTGHEWDFSDGTHATGLPIQDHVYLDDGLYEVGYTVNESDGDSNHTHATVRVLNAPPDVEVGDDILVDEDEVIEFNGSFIDPGILDTHTFEWVYGDGTADSDTLVPRHTYIEPGIYTVQLTVRDDDGGIGIDTLQVTVRDATHPVAVSQGDITVDQGATVTFDASGSHDNDAIASYTWTFLYDGQMVTLTRETTEFDFDTVGIYNVRLTVTDLSLLEGFTDFTVIVRDTVNPLVRAGDDVTIDNGEVVNLDGSRSTDNVDMVRFTWTFTYGGEAKTLVGDTVSFLFAIPGIYTVDLKVTDAEGNTGQDTVVVTVLDTEAPVASAGSDVAVIVGDSVRLDGTSSTDNVGITSFTWSYEKGGETRTEEGGDVTLIMDEVGEFEITLEVVDARGNSALDTVIVVVLPVEVPWSLGPFANKKGNAIVEADIVIELNGTIYLGATDEAGNLDLSVSRFDLVSPAKVTVTKEGWKTQEFEVFLDDEGDPTGDIPPMEKKEKDDSPSLGLMGVIAALGLIVLMMRRRDRS